MTARYTRRAAATAVAGIVALGTAACGSGKTDQQAAPAPVSLKPAGAVSKVSIGVVVSLTSAPGQGADWNQAAEGAAVAGYRFRLAGAKVTIVPANDKGTVAGGRTAVQDLVDKGVSGIVLATEGSHVSGALAAAQSAGVPVLLPYSPVSTGLPDVAWTTGPDSEQIGKALTDSLDSRGVSRPLLVDAGGGTPDGVVATRRFSFGAGDDPAKLAKAIAKKPKNGAGNDGVVVSGPAGLQADVLAALQGRTAELPVLLTPQALSPAFGPDVEKSGGTLAGDLTTVGLEGGDTTAMQPGTEGATASAFFAALRAAAGDAKLKDFFDDEPFSTVADLADTRSHDAVVALVTASAKAGSRDPAKVAAALAKLKVTRDEGLAGPDLDFTDRAAVSGDRVSALQATTQDPGLRPTASATDTTAVRLFWFTAPQS